MNYYIKERKFDDETAKTAWSKARDDVEQICESKGYGSILVWPDFGNRKNLGRVEKLKMHFRMKGIWERQTEDLQRGDVLLIQLPVINNCIFLSSILNNLKKRGVSIVGLVHDLELLRLSIVGNVSLQSKIRMRIEENNTLVLCDKLIVHNEKMRDYLEKQGMKHEKMLCLGIFDYLMSKETEEAVLKRTIPEDYATLIVAGNLSPEKAGYVYAAPGDVSLILYGVFYQENEKENLHYKGAFKPEELPEKLNGGFGLVWDGTSADTCTGVYGEYLRYNNPHKTSLYLASGIPVVIWKEAALAEFVLRENVGIVAGSLEEAADKVRKMTLEEYRVLFENAQNVGRRIRNGEFLKEVLNK